MPDELNEREIGVNRLADFDRSMQDAPMLAKLAFLSGQLDAFELSEQPPARKVVQPETVKRLGMVADKSATLRLMNNESEIEARHELQLVEDYEDSVEAMEPSSESLGEMSERGSQWLLDALGPDWAIKLGVEGDELNFQKIARTIVALLKVSSSGDDERNVGRIVGYLSGFSNEQIINFSTGGYTLSALHAYLTNTKNRLMKLTEEDYKRFRKGYVYKAQESLSEDELAKKLSPLIVNALNGIAPGIVNELNLTTDDSLVLMEALMYVKGWRKPDRRSIDIWKTLQETFENTPSSEIARQLSVTTAKVTQTVKVFLRSIEQKYPVEERTRLLKERITFSRNDDDFLEHLTQTQDKEKAPDTFEDPALIYHKDEPAKDETKASSTLEQLTFEYQRNHRSEFGNIPRDFMRKLSPSEIQKIPSRFYEDVATVQDAIERPDVVSKLDWLKHAKGALTQAALNAGFTEGEAGFLWRQFHFAEKMSPMLPLNKHGQKVMETLANIFREHGRRKLAGRRLPGIAVQTAISKNGDNEYNNLIKVYVNLNKNDATVDMDMAQRYLVVGIVELFNVL